MTTGRDAVQEAIDRVHDAIAKVDRLAHMRDNTSTSNITVTGATGWQVTVCLLLAVMGVMCGAFGLYIAADTRNTQGRDSMELRQDIKAIRAYINAGMVKPQERKN